MRILDTGYLFLPAVIITTWHGLWLFLALAGFPFGFLSVIGYVIILRSLKDDGEYVKYVFVIFVWDILTYFQLQFLFDPLFLFPLLLLFMIYSIIYLDTMVEVKYFQRTIASMSERDQALARKALKTKEIDDILKVAEYQDWSSLDL